MKATLLSLILFPALIALSACSNTNILPRNNAAHGIMTKQTRSAPSFTAIEASRGVTVIFTQSPRFGIEVEAPADVIDMVTASVSGHDLSIYIDESIRRIDFDAIVRVSAPMVTDFDLSAGAALTCDSLSAADKDVEIEATSGSTVTFEALSASRLAVGTSSGASVHLSGIAATTVDIEASSGSSITLLGTASDGKIDASSGASVSASRLRLATASVDVSSGAALSCNVLQFSHRHVSSGGSISSN